MDIMRVIIKQHPGTGLWVTSDGRVIMPPDGHRFFKFRFTFGSKDKNGYMLVKFRGKTYKVHRILAETFLPNPLNLPTVDHINRDKTDNRAFENLQWASYKQNNNNKQVCEDSLAKYGVRKSEDNRAYDRAYKREYYSKNIERERARHRARDRELRADPEFAERERARGREYGARQRLLGKRYRRCPDGSSHWLTDSEYDSRFGSSQQIPLF